MAGWGKAGGEPGNLASRWLAGPLVSGGTRCSYQNASFRANRLGGGGTHLWRRQLCPVELRSHATPRSPNAPIAGVRDEPRLSNCFQARTLRHEAGRDHNATRSFLANATAVILRMRPRMTPTRSTNQRASLLSG